MREIILWLSGTMPLEASPIPDNGRGAGGIGVAPAPALDTSWERAEAGLVKRPDSGTDRAGPVAGQGRAGLWRAGALLRPSWAGLAVEADMFSLLAQDPLASFLKYLYLRKTPSYFLAAVMGWLSARLGMPRKTLDKMNRNS